MTAPKPMTRAELADKIAKLANLSIENGATESEAAAAAAKMQHILNNYNLTQADLAPDIAAKKNPMVAKTVKLTRRYEIPEIRPTRHGQPWKRNLAYRLADATFTTALTGSATATFLGAETDVETAVYMFEYLSGVLDEMARVYTAQFTDDKIAELGYENKSFLRGEFHPSVVRNSWLAGAVNTVTKSMNKEQKDFASQSNKAGAMVTARATAAKAYAMEQYKTAFKRKGFVPGDSKRNWDAYADGKEAGEKITVAKGVTDGKKKATKKLAAPAPVAA